MIPNNTAGSIWDIYIDAYIVDVNLVWSGPHANTLPLPTPIHVITAHNPFEEVLSEHENTSRNDALYTELAQQDLEIKTVIGKSPSGDWQEESFAIHGLTREQACSIACNYNQRGIFEILEDELLVIEVSTQEIKRRCSRSSDV